MPLRGAFVCLFAFTILTVSSSAFAQIDTGTIVGRVTDPSGGVLPGVTVAATQQVTRIESSSVTKANGEDRFHGFRVGLYEVAAELHGFRRTVREKLHLNVPTAAEVDLQLGVVGVTEQATVTGRSEVVQTQTAGIGNIVVQRQVLELALLGRRYSELDFLKPGVVAAPA